MERKDDNEKTLRKRIVVSIPDTTNLIVDLYYNSYRECSYRNSIWSISFIILMFSSRAFENLGVMDYFCLLSVYVSYDLEPLCGLIATDIKCPNTFRYSFKVLRIVDPNSTSPIIHLFSHFFGAFGRIIAFGSLSLCFHHCFEV